MRVVLKKELLLKKFVELFLKKVVLRNCRTSFEEINSWKKNVELLLMKLVLEKKNI